MRSFEVYRFRRIALRWTKKELADKAEILVVDIDRFESGLEIDSEKIVKLKRVIDDGFRNLDTIEHYKTRIMELAYEIRFDQDPKQILQRTSHVMVELGKLQKALIDGVSV